MRKSVSPGDAKPFRPIEVSADECDGSFERMLRRFTRRFRDEGVESELRSRRGFVKPSQVRRLKAKSVPRRTRGD
jgi:ribosomal protein S21